MQNTQQASNVFFYLFKRNIFILYLFLQSWFTFNALSKSSLQDFLQLQHDSDQLMKTHVLIVIKGGQYMGNVSKMLTHASTAWKWCWQQLPPHELFHFKNQKVSLKMHQNDCSASVGLHQQLQEYCPAARIHSYFLYYSIIQLGYKYWVGETVYVPLPGTSQYIYQWENTQLCAWLLLKSLAPRNNSKVRNGVIKVKYVCTQLRTFSSGWLLVFPVMCSCFSQQIYTELCLKRTAGDTLKLLKQRKLHL